MSSKNQFIDKFKVPGKDNITVKTYKGQHYYIASVIEDMGDGNQTQVRYITRKYYEDCVIAACIEVYGLTL